MIRFVALAAIFAAQSVAACPEQPDALKLTALEQGAPAAFASFDKPPLSAPFEMRIAFCVADDDVVNELEFDAIMPAHQHGMNYQVEISGSEDSQFLVSNIVFHMPGLWQMNISVRNGNQTFDYTAEVPLE